MHRPVYSQNDVCTSASWKSAVGDSLCIQKLVTDIAEVGERDAVTADVLLQRGYTFTKISFNNKTLLHFHETDEWIKTFKRQECELSNYKLSYFYQS